MWDSENNLLKGNTIIDDDVGIFLDQSDNNMITENKATNNIHGIRIWGEGNVVSRNIANYNGWGISGYLAISNSFKMNEVKYNTNYGFHFAASTSNEISLNEVEDNGYGIYVYSSNANTICSNNFANGIIGIQLFVSYNNMIYHNNIISNTYQVLRTMSSNTWDNGAGEGNYWSDYTGIDTTGDGIGDTNIPHPHINMGMGYYKLDNYPLTSPWTIVDEMIDDVQDMGLPDGTENSLISKLDNAKKSIEKGNDNAAANQLEAFINQVEALRGKKLTDEEADSLIEMAQWLLDSI
jgi:parallel beta-helix repeat protein